MSKFIVVAALLATAASVAQAQTPVAPPVAPPAASAAPSQRSAGAWLALGLTQQADGDNPAAKASLDEALKSQPDLAVARLTRATVLADLKETDAAIADVDALGAFAPPEQILRMKIDIFLKGDRKAQAIDTAKALVALTPNSADAYRRLGLVYKASGDEAGAKAALAAYDKALKLDPDMLGLYALRSDLLVDRRDARGLERNYDAWLAKASDKAKVHVAYADALSDLGKTDKALAEMDKAIQLNPSLNNYLTRARLWPDDRQDAALADIDKALALDPKSSHAYYVRAVLRMGWKQPDLALADADKLLALQPDSYGARMVRYDVHQGAARYDLALKELDILIAAHPKDAILFNNRCWTRGLANRELDLALADCETSLKLRTSAANLDSRAFIKLRQGDLAGSIADYDAALKLSPDQGASLYGRGVAKRRAGQTAEGDADLAKARTLSPDIDKRFAGYGVTP